MKKSLDGLSRTAFWDVDFERLDLSREKDFIVTKVFNYGLADDMRFVFKRYGKDSVKDALIRASYLTNQAFALAQAIFSLPPEQFLCFTRKQSTKTLWPY